MNGIYGGLTVCSPCPADARFDPLLSQSWPEAHDAAWECPHGRLGGDPTPPCGCWPGEKRRITPPFDTQEVEDLMATATFDEATIREFWRLYDQEGMTPEQVAANFGCDGEDVRRALRADGKTLRRGRPPVRPITSTEEAEELATPASTFLERIRQQTDDEIARLESEAKELREQIRTIDLSIRELRGYRQELVCTTR